ncbi:hypothetical protein V2I01_05160 [Micromonospora sp. BRA006-A]|nr:hypothetical protein [Micromonospora sp. BRA006-A]
MLLGAAQPPVAAPRRAEQWYLDELRIDRAHQISTGRGVVVGVVDTGVDAGHPTCRASCWPGGTRDSGDGRRDRTVTAPTWRRSSRPTGPGWWASRRRRILPTSETRRRRVHLGRLRAGHPDGCRRQGEGAQPVVAVPEPWRRRSRGSAIRYALERDVVVVAAAGNARRAGPDDHLTRQDPRRDRGDRRSGAGASGPDRPRGRRR